MFFDILIDVILLGIFFAGAYYGYKKGLFRMAVEPFRVLICFFVAFSFYETVSQGIVAPVITPTVRNYLFEFCQKTSIDGAIDKLPAMLRVALAIFNSSALDNMDKAYGAEALVNRLIDPLVRFLSGIIAFIILYVIVRLFSRLALNVIGCFLEGGILGRVNSLMGVVLSGFVGFAVACLTASLIDYALHLDAFSDLVASAGFRGGAIYRIMREVNLIRLVFSL